MSKRADKIEIRKSLGGEWYWRIVAPNGRILAHSETYSSLTKARQTVENLGARTRWHIEVRIIHEDPK